MKPFVSSAKSLMSDLVLFSMSLVYIRNNNGPSTEPCGTPQFIAFVGELTPFAYVNCLRLFK